MRDGSAVLASDPVTLQRIKSWASFGGRQSVYRHGSVATGTQMDLSVFTPPGETKATLLFLSGLTCNWENATAKAGFQRLAAKLGLAVVCPDTSPRGDDVADDAAYDLGQGAGFYVDATREPWAPHFRMYSYVAQELLERLGTDLGLPVQRLGITGHSMGGHGALTLALRQPARFVSVSAFAPIVAPSEVPWGRKALGAYLGEDREAWLQHDACALLRRRPHPAEILVDQGDADEFLDEQLQTERFAEAARQAGQPTRIRMQPGYDHSYYTIATFIDDHLEHHARALT